MFPLSRRVPGWACCLAVMALGCGSGAPAHLYPVSGEVTVEGKPLAAGSVALHPDRTRGNQSQEIPVGQIKEGRYVIYTGKHPGAPLGAYKVAVTADNFSGGAAPAKGATAEAPRSLINTKYGDPLRTPLSYEVVAKPEAGAYDLKVTR
jgi:hypothetical protein